MYRCTFSSCFRALMACVASAVPRVVLLTIFWTETAWTCSGEKIAKKTKRQLKAAAESFHTHLDQQLKSCNPLERKHKEGAKRKSLTNSTLLYFLHDHFKPWILIPGKKREILTIIKKNKQTKIDTRKIRTKQRKHTVWFSGLHESLISCILIGLVGEVGHIGFSEERTLPTNDVADGEVHDVWFHPLLQFWQKTKNHKAAFFKTKDFKRCACKAQMGTGRSMHAKTITIYYSL